MVLPTGVGRLSSGQLTALNRLHSLSDAIAQNTLRLSTLKRINSAKGLDDEEKVNLQQYITRIYGTLTTFNVLFKHKDDYFVGDSSK